MNKIQTSIALILALVFVIICAVFGKSAPNVEIAEGGAISKTETTAEIHTQPPEEDQPETPAAQYIELPVIATAYCPCVKCCGKNDGITATGTKATAGRTLAADPSVIPYGTEVIIGDITYVVEDCGGAVKGAKVDIFFNTHEEALQWGKRNVVATIVK